MVFFSIGTFKVSSLEFGKFIFPDFLDNGIRGAAVGWMRPLLEWIQSLGPARVGVAVGFVELFIGIAMILGLAVRPAALMGMLYSAGLFFATLDQSPSSTPSMLQSAEHQFRNLFPFLIFLLLGVGHAGETWGVGSLYHRHRARRWEKEAETEPAPAAPAPVPPKEPGSFEEFLEQEQRGGSELENEWTATEARDE